ncbi:MAG: MscS family mechanosensitive ion channel [uncultured Sulfurovum sp.]|uniref:MscS family mechanosensitive ion channel n=1 Tax=uncultured Sulfurovum sp. TaxID=269237 RepID=A0A6S6SXK0_9BACT|nr:MAG: MscS family mechanosensitive ion channel [uncultured Sulfurovum sp.]
MRNFLLFIFLTLQVLQADSNLSNETNSTFIEMLEDENKEKNRVGISISENTLEEKKKESIYLIENALEQKKAEEKRKAKEESKRKEIIKEAQRLAEAKKLAARIAILDEKKQLIDTELSKDNMWASQYAPYETYRSFNMKLQKVADEVKDYKNEKNLSEVEKLELKRLEEEYKIVSGKISQLSEYRSNPFVELIKPIKLEGEPVITNPLDIITAMSYQKHLKTLKEDNDRKYTSLSIAVVKIREKKKILEELSVLSENKKYVEELGSEKNKLKDFELALEVFETSVDTFIQKVSQVNLNIDKGIENEVKRSIVTGIIILILLLLFILVKFLVRKYMSDNDLFYGINKVVNFVFIFIVFIILLLTYLENVENLMTILSFASAGIAIALKDWFMSVLGWLVILVSGSIHVGDRVKFVKDGVEYVGDIVDISILRMTLHEDVTLTTIMLNKRSGRIVFIPNNYIFTDMIANYSHSGLKTVWDGVEFIVTFDSNIAKVQSIAKEVTRKYSKGYTDMTRNQLNRLRSKYSVRNTGVEPRIFTIFEPYGMRVSAWYLTNSYATLTLRTTISVEILRRINETNEIHLALPSQSLYMNESVEKRVALKEGEEPSANHKT